MEKENGDDYVRRTASFIRTHERRLAEATVTKRRTQRPPQGSLSVLGWIGLGSAEPAKKPLVFTEDPHHLFYLLMRFEALGIDVGSLDIRVQNPSRPTSMSYLAMLALKDRSDVLSISSLRSSISSVSMFSLGGGWLGRLEPASVDAELKYLYSAFTKIPALRVRASGLKVVSELADDPPTDSAVPMDAFKNLQMLECHDIDPRILMGWDRLSEGLRSLVVKRSGVEDVSDLLIDSVVDDKARREGNPSRVARPRLIHRPLPSIRSRQPSFHAAQLPSSVPEDAEQTSNMAANGPELARHLPSYAWSLLAHLSLSDNSLTFLPSLPHLPSLSSLDLSSNLLVSIPPTLSALPALKSLNLAHNMVDSVLGIYSQIPSIVTLNLCANRLESLCGLERLDHLVRVDLRDNRVDDTGEVGRLAVQHEVKEIWVSGNPCTRRDQDWRVRCFDMFAKEGREVTLDGSPAGIMERRAMTYTVGGHADPSSKHGRPLSTAPSPSVVTVTSSPRLSPSNSPSLTTISEPPPGDATANAPSTLSAISSLSSARGQGLLPAAATPRARRRKNKRIVDLDDRESTDESSRETRRGHTRHNSDASMMLSLAERRERTSQLPNPQASAVRTRHAPQPTPPIAESSSLSRVAGRLTPSLTMDTVSPTGSARNEPPATISQIRAASATRTLSSTKTNKRRARISASVYEPAGASQTFLEREQENDGKLPSEAELFRKRIEALRSEVGDSWLKVLSQTQFARPADESAIRRKS